MHRDLTWRLMASVGCLSVIVFQAPCHAGVDDPWADTVVSFDAGIGPVGGFDDPTSVLGEPERMTGGDVFPGVVSIFNPPWIEDQIYSIGETGWITVRFDTPVTDDPDNPFGIDLLIFGNAFFFTDYLGANDITGVLDEGGLIEVSPDGIQWAAVGGAADGLYPTQGFSDAEPFESTPTREAADFTRPVNPAATLGHFLGLQYGDAVSLYDGSGGAPVDIAASGFAEISYVRVSSVVFGVSVEIDAFADVTPATPGDTNRDSVVNVQDLINVVLQWGPIGPGSISADLNGDGVIDVIDLLAVILGWTP